MIIEGSVEDIIFRNDENNYTVLLLASGKDLITVVGKVAAINIGDYVKVVGNYVQNAKFGKQFVIDQINFSAPSNIDSIKKFLASGLIKGVGEKTAENIVNMFKEDTLNIIEYYPTKLSMVRGVSLKKANEISASYNETKKTKDSIMFLQNYGITINKALKILEKYKGRTIQILTENPYKLIEDIDGIGFSSADKIANTMGIEQNNPFRVKAGIVHVLKEYNEKSGNTCLPQGFLINQASILLKLDFNENSKLLFDSLKDLIDDNILARVSVNDDTIITTTKYYNIEKGTAKKLLLLNYSKSANVYNLDKDISLFEKFNNVIFHIDQKNAVINSINNNISIITGGPGTGKTTIIKCILEIFKGLDKKILLLAPTGRASKRLSESTGEEAKTIHRALEINFGSNNQLFKYNEYNQLPYDVIIIDEVSMIDSLLFNHLLKAIKRDCNLILVGDKDQLPSVGAGNVLADLLGSKLFKISNLTKIYRQDEHSTIVSNAHLINSGSMPNLNNDSKDFFYESKTENIDIAKTVIGLVSNRLPKYLNIDTNKIQVLCPMKVGLTGVENLNKSLQEILNPKDNFKEEFEFENITYRENDRVIQTVNNYQQEWVKKEGFVRINGLGVFNGDMGVIRYINKRTNEATVVFEDEREAIYPKSELKQLIHSYAITIHKSQGSEFDAVVIPVIAGSSQILTRNLLYTAITRAKKLVVLVGEKKNISRMVHNNFTNKRYTLLNYFLEIENEEIKKLYN